MPSLATYEAHKVNFTWVVPTDQAIGIVPVSWQADPDGINSADSDTSNNYAELSMFVGRLPTPQLVDSSALTLERIQLEANQSFDEDGGIVWCTFDIEFDDGSYSTANQKVMRSSCSLNWYFFSYYLMRIYHTSDKFNFFNLI